MFEKLKEYAIYIILWVLWLWILVYSYLSLTNWNSWQDFLTAIQTSISEWLQASQQEKDNSTITNFVKKIWWKSLWKYNLDWNQVIFFNIDWDQLLTNWVSNTIILENQLKTTQTTSLWYIQLYLFPHKKLNYSFWDEWEWYILENNKISWWMSKQKSELYTVDPILRWFQQSWYIWLWSFKNESDAKILIEEYFPNWSIFKLNDHQFWILLEYNA